MSGVYFEWERILVLNSLSISHHIYWSFLGFLVMPTVTHKNTDELKFSTASKKQTLTFHTDAWRELIRQRK